jgi:hypothetical protein
VAVHGASVRLTAGTRLGRRGASVSLGVGRGLSSHGRGQSLSARLGLRGTARVGFKGAAARCSRGRGLQGAACGLGAHGASGSGRVAWWLGARFFVLALGQLEADIGRPVGVAAASGEADSVAPDASSRETGRRREKRKWRLGREARGRRLGVLGQGCGGWLVGPSGPNSARARVLYIFFFILFSNFFLW